MTRLHELYDDEGQGPWLDNVRRDWLRDGTMARFVADGIRGVTSNPTIFAKALEATEDYDEQLAAIADAPADEAFVAMAGQDIADTAALLAGVHDASDGADGFVSFEVSPTLAYDTDATIAAAKAISARFAAREPAGQGARHGGRAPRDRRADRRGHQRQRHADLRAGALRPGHRRVPRRHGARLARRA